MRFNDDWTLPLILIWNFRRNVNRKLRQLCLMHSPSVELVYNKSLSIAFRKSFLFPVCSMWSCFVSLESAISKPLGIPAELSKKQFIIVRTWEIWQILKKQILFFRLETIALNKKCSYLVFMIYKLCYIIFLLTCTQMKSRNS